MVDWKKQMQALIDQGLQMPSKGVHITCNHSLSAIRDVVVDCYTACLAEIGESYQPLAEIDSIVDWLHDNHYKGLLLQGHCGRGKTFLARYVLPLLIKTIAGRIVSYYDMTRAIRCTDDVLRNYIIILDDVGTEGKFQDYGNTRSTLAEVVDAAEKDGKLVIITTNLTTDELRQQYGERTVDRLHKLTTQVIFQGKSFR